MGNTALLSEHRVWEDAVSALGSLHLQMSLPSQAHNLTAFLRQS